MSLIQIFVSLSSIHCTQFNKCMGKAGETSTEETLVMALSHNVSSLCPQGITRHHAFNAKKKKKKQNEQGKKFKEAEPEEFVVEKELDWHAVKGKVRYFLKRKRLTDADNTLEREENLDCPELIEAFLNSQKAGKENIW